MSPLRLHLARAPGPIRVAVCAVLLAVAAPMIRANTNGLPLGATGYAPTDDRTCQGSGCHRPEPLGGTANVIVEAGAYVPSAPQIIRVVIQSASADRWGYQLAVRRASDPTKRAGSLSTTDLFNVIRCANGNPPPCTDDQLEYATHTSLGTRPGGRPGRMTFAVTWTPPESDIGEVIFTAAALAANNDLGTASDVTATTISRSIYAPSNMPRANVGGVVGAAAFGQKLTSVISPKSLISVFGINLAAPGTARAVSAADLDAEGKIPVQIGRVGLDIFVPGIPNLFQARILFVGDKQINAQAPDFPIVGNEVMVQPVINRGLGASEVRGNMVSVQVRQVSPELFTFDGSGQNDVAAVHSVTGTRIAATGKYPFSSPARPGDVILIYGTGYGDTDPSFPPGALADAAANILGPIRVTIGNYILPQEDVLYAGVAPTFAGLYQFNVRVPRVLPPGDHAISIRAANFNSQPGVFLTIGPPLAADE